MDMYQKRKIRKENANINENTNGGSKTNINCLSCIYTVHRLNLYKMGLFSK